MKIVYKGNKEIKVIEQMNEDYDAFNKSDGKERSQSYVAFRDQNLMVGDTGIANTSDASIKSHGNVASWSAPRRLSCHFLRV